MNENIFQDPEFKKQILASEGRVGNDEPEEVEILGQDNEPSLDFKSLVASAPTMPKSAKNVIADASLIAKGERDKANQEMKLAVSEVFSRYNKEYGLDLNINLDNLSQSLVLISSPKERRVLELYVSECFKSVKPILLLHLLQKLVLLCDYVLKPETLSSGQFTGPDYFCILEKVEQLIMNLGDIIDTAAVKNSDLELDRLASEHGDTDLASAESKAAVEEFMKLFNKGKEG